jgi:hypothetical protein
MLRGAIDYSDGRRVGGWLYAPELPMRDRTILAFVDTACVGAGKVDVFRQDLLDAGLGDGHCGFDFPVTLARIDDRKRVHVRLELSDFSLLQQDCAIVVPASAQESGRQYSSESIDWMREQKWVDAADERFLRDLLVTGAHEHELAGRPEVPGDAASEAKRLFELYRQGPVRVQQSVIRLQNLADERSRLIEGAAIPILAIHAPDGDVVLGASIGFACGDDRLLLVDARTTMSGNSDKTARLYRAA